MKRPRCKKCDLSMIKESYRHCQDCGREYHGKKRTCPDCDGRVVSESYWHCPSCGKQQ